MPGNIEPSDHLEYNWTSADGLRLFAQSWMPAGQPRAIINYVHGFKDHSSRFAGWAQKLTGEGYGVFAVDLRGHGRSDGRRGYAEKFERYLQDVQVMCEYSRNRYGSLPHILYGHSLGGSIVTNYLISDRTQPEAAVITSPWFKLSFNPSIFMRIGAGFLRYCAPGVLVTSDLDPHGLSRDPAVVEAYRHDPLVHSKIAPKLFFAIEKYGLKASHSIYKINIPLLVMHGSSDPVTSCRQTRAFVLNAGSRTTFREWDGCKHELHNDLMADEVFAFLLSWLDKQVTR
jgi:alpha-beta hydrolase superfamily lysophospholipase